MRFLIDCRWFKTSPNIFYRNSKPVQVSKQSVGATSAWNRKYILLNALISSSGLFFFLFVMICNFGFSQAHISGVLKENTTATSLGLKNHRTVSTAWASAYLDCSAVKTPLFATLLTFLILAGLFVFRSLVARKKTFTGVRTLGL